MELPVASIGSVRIRIFPSSRGEGNVFNVNVEVIFVDVFTIGRYEGIFRMVKIVDEALMKWKSCTQDGGYYGLFGRYVLYGCGEWGLYGYRMVGKCPADFVCHDFAYTLYVAAEADAVTLYMHITDFRKELVEKAVALVKVDYFHKHFQVLRSFII